MAGSKLSKKPKKKASKPVKKAKPKPKKALKLKKVKKPTKVKIKIKKAVSKKLLKKRKLSNSGESVKLRRAESNPIIEPRGYPWESKATFNPAAFEAHGKIHIIYRAIGENDTSVLGYAASKDGFKIGERPTYFVYDKLMGTYRLGAPIVYESGGGWSGGCEDPRLTVLDNTVYMLYTAFDGWGSLRIALTSIKLSDFKKKAWKWEKPIMISPPGEIHKNWVLFPEKIKGKYVILHSIAPEILIESVDSMDEFDGNKFIKSHHGHAKSQEESWDNWVRGAGPPPIKTSAGWLVLYHAMDNKDPDRYKLGAMILDLKNPKKVLYRSNSPILEPEERYENEGWKSGVIYSCGAVVKDGDLIVYYGGADKVVCVASINLSELIDHLKKNKVIKLKNKKLIKP